jgi:surface protein
MGKNNNLTDFLTDIANAIRTKKGTKDPINAQDFATEISSIYGGNTGSTTPSVPTPVRPTYTGHADAEGLRAIGWTEEDIAYYQENGVNWNEEDDQYHLVTDDNKALYGVLTADNISTYKDRIVYLPKIDTSNVMSMGNKFNNCCSLVSIPLLDTSKVTEMAFMFSNCYSLVTIPPLDTSNVTTMSRMFYNCCSLVTIPPLDTSKVTKMDEMFYNCYSLVSVPQLDTSKVTTMYYMFNNCRSLVSIPLLDTSNVTTMYYMFNTCYSLVSIPLLDTSKVTGGEDLIFYNCYSLTHANIKNAKLAYNLSVANLLSKESLLYLINNEVATRAITIKLASYAYTRLAEDADIVAALANHPNISISK